MGPKSYVMTSQVGRSIYQNQSECLNTVPIYATLSLKTSLHYPMGTRGSFPGGKAAGAWS